MSTNFNQTGKELALKNIVGRTFSTNLYVKLYINNLIVSNSTSLDDINECQTINYAPIQLLQSNWIFQDGTASYNDLQFHLGENAIIYGYFVTQNDILLYIEPFSSAIELNSNGGVVYININMGFY